MLHRLREYFVIQHEHHLEQRMTTRVVLRWQRFHHLLECHILVLVCLCYYPSNKRKQSSEGEGTIYPGPQYKEIGGTVSFISDAVQPGLSAYNAFCAD